MTCERTKETEIVEIGKSLGPQLPTVREQAESFWTPNVGHCSLKKKKMKMTQKVEPRGQRTQERAMGWGIAS
jgi:hypothetical protein